MRNWVKAALLTTVSIGVGIGIGAGIWVGGSEELEPDNQPPKTVIYSHTVDSLARFDGIEDADGVVKFLGVPFADQPVRFAESEMKTSFNNGVFDATTFGSRCFGARSELNQAASEDCLNLNIYTTKTVLQGKEKVPVLFFMHPGAFFSGSNADQDQHAETFVFEHNFIVVQINYRLGPAGFWFNPAAGEDEHESNWGLLDQRLALKWVNNFIESFNGDTDRVTLSGCSAGGQSALAHAVSEDSWPYFKQVSQYSGPLGIPYFNADQAVQIYDSVAMPPKCLNCTDAADLECARKVTMQQLYDCSWPKEALLADPGGPFKQSRDMFRLTQLAEPYAPVYNTKFLPMEPYHMIARGMLKPKSKLIQNYVTDEGEEFIESVFYPNGYDNRDEKRAVRMPKLLFERGMKATYNKGDEESTNGQTVIDMYSEKCADQRGRKDCGEAAADWLTDMTWICTSRSAFNQYIEATKENADAAEIYMVEHYTPFPTELQVASWNRQCYEKSCHCANNWWLMGSYERKGIITDPKELEYGRRFRAVHYDFYSTGSLPKMEPYNGDQQWYYTDKSMLLEKRTMKEEECNVFDEMNLYMDV